ncbi:hypothetical protein ACIGW4_16200 [Streptomyces sp. NPDC053513]|uniref:hypothetical protein n=1 Tax=unclassified Streptomyces TaxID=2593676 RepID=UPI0037CE0377
MNGNNDHMRDDVRERGDALVALGRPAEARAAARGALDADGPDTGLLLALAHAHMAADDDDHDHDHDDGLGEHRYSGYR